MTTSANLDPDICYRAMQARDRRFDGLFFVAVTTTGIYCRPICPARLAAATRCRFFLRALDAERAGFRACFRCRPELAPGLAQVDSASRLVGQAMARIDAGYLNEHSVDELATTLGVTARHLRRALLGELGATPVALAQARRLALSKQLLQDTALPVSDIAFSAGFASLRRFNALFSRCYGCAPSALRKRPGPAPSEALSLHLEYRPPLDWPAVLAFLGKRAIPGVEAVRAGSYRRYVEVGRHSGWLEVSQDGQRAALLARLSLSLLPAVLEVTARLRAWFDLDAQPAIVGDHLAGDPILGPLLRRQPGLRLLGAFDGFEMAVRAVVGQRISVSAATTVCGRLVARFGDGAERRAPSGESGQLWPRPETLAEQPVAALQALGLPAKRAQTLIALSRAVALEQVRLVPGGDPLETEAALRRIPGIGPWTAQILAMRALKWPDAFPASDLGVLRALGVTSPAAAEARASAWRPWRSYAVMHLWSAAATIKEDA
jgi:AraC family transcriptional regulator of adaptative response / DNA-3-methyladenine glycosylase II